MVNPQSELYQKHPDWIISQPKRAPILGRNQEILDLTRPEVQAYEWGIIDKTLRPNPGITYVKWDCNRYITQPGSSYLPSNKQSHLWTDYTWALYRLMKRFAKDFPNVMAMLCAGGAGRVDYGALPYFITFGQATTPIRWLVSRYNGDFLIFSRQVLFLRMSLEWESGI